ncbi:hypothetical protein KIPB_004477 [Kipferlia bialata]|uniref:Uncharacterized protein n=1 Tax=Kipferlia bialata TaxID=797122 RepID=A0A9K3CVS0_9EUKA|nr:hypothetical protein KIPB_004477 [Kipferlia bialata]|eukprot:g4477.t1
MTPKPSHKSVSGKGVNAAGNKYTSYTDGGYAYQNQDGGRYYNSTTGNFYTPPSQSGGSGRGYYQSTTQSSGGEWAPVPPKDSK